MLKKLFKIDYIILGTVAGLLFLGILILSSVSAIISQENFGNTTYYLFHQIKLGILPGLFLAAIFYFLPLKFLKKYAWFLVAVNLIAIIFVLIPGMGIIAGGAPRWLKLGPVSFQPSEFLKLSFVLYIASWLSSPMRNEKKQNFKYTFVPFLIIATIVSFLFFMQSDISTLAVIMISAGIMYFVSNTPLWHTLLLFSGASALFLLLIFTSSYRTTRLKIMLGLISDPMGLGYQIKQILIGIGSGGIAGLGLGMSNQKFGFIPQIMSDSIFAVYSEEVGFLGSLLLISLLIAFLFRAFQIVKRSKDNFSKLFAIGFSSWICIQAFINIGAMVGIIPLTGIPLPFLSYGGSHIVAELIGVGILLNISKNTQK